MYLKKPFMQNANIVPSRIVQNSVCLSRFSHYLDQMSCLLKSCLVMGKLSLQDFEADAAATKHKDLSDKHKAWLWANIDTCQSFIFHSRPDINPLSHECRDVFPSIRCQGHRQKPELPLPPYSSAAMSACSPKHTIYHLGLSRPMEKT